MIIKELDDVEPSIKALESLRARPGVSARTKKKIEREIRNIRAGAKAEKGAAYEINFHYGASKNWMIIHDLRLEHENLVAQIDHLIINRFLDIVVCESKSFSEGIEINERGEYAALYRNTPRGIPSPFEQNGKHIEVLRAAFKSGLVRLPRRLGLSIQPSYRNLILISKYAQINRPSTDIPDLDSLIKVDQMKPWLEKMLDSDNNPLTLGKVVSTDTVEMFARSLASVHRPLDFNWAAKFGISDDKSSPQNKDTQSAEGKKKSKLACASCTVSVPYVVAQFCWKNKARFGGDVYCRDCQGKF
ncbi:nuclease-related domain-containing protein [Thioalkalivibrio thiocyanodenitrificans]|uniref:nuclease-related domain-containing protein n=1 Tax=Thioalkalivibrio thiocyanodenitrificans TaxID=243063 RepID=UPI0003668442|nr:nuclease-related domain-containing protein [Thioalkalivibrio thiocyanodenitrificans]